MSQAFDLLMRMLDDPKFLAHGVGGEKLSIGKFDLDGDAQKGDRKFEFEIEGVNSLWANSSIALRTVIENTTELQGKSLLSLFEDRAGDGNEDCYHAVSGNLDPDKGPIWAIAYHCAVEDPDNKNGGQLLVGTLLESAEDIRQEIQDMRIAEARRIVDSIGERIKRTVGDDPVVGAALLAALRVNTNTQGLVADWDTQAMDGNTPQASGSRKSGPGRL